MGLAHRQIHSEMEVGWDEVVVEEPDWSWSFEPCSAKAVSKSYAEVEEWDGEVGTCHWAWEERLRPWAVGCGQRNYGVACEASHVEGAWIPLGQDQDPPPRLRPRRHRHPCS